MRIIRLNAANFVSLGRVILLAGIPVFGFDRATAAALVVLSFLLDGVDGWVARRVSGVTQLGSFLDLAGDRIVEITLWVALVKMADLSPIFAEAQFIRMAIVDLVRFGAYSQGLTPPSGILLRNWRRGAVLSAASRGGYAAAKAAFFSLSIVTLGSAGGHTGILTLQDWLLGLVLLLSAVRAVGIIYEHGLLLPKIVFGRHHGRSTLAWGSTLGHLCFVGLSFAGILALSA